MILLMRSAVKLRWSTWHTDSHLPGLVLVRQRCRTSRFRLYFSSPLTVFVSVTLHPALLLVCDSLCTLTDLPATVQPCLLPKACQLSEWTEWSPCSKTCIDFNNSRGNRTRNRQVLQLSVGDELDCPPLEETESCDPLGETSIPCAK